LVDLPYDILEHIFQFLTLQDCVRSLSSVCSRFHEIVDNCVKLWVSLDTDFEFNVDSFTSVIVNHVKHFHKLGVRFSQKCVRYNRPDKYIENTLGLCQNLVYLDLSYNTSITTVDFISNIKCLKSLTLTGCTSIEPYKTLYCVKYNGSFLESLNISKCLQFSDEHMGYLID
jgi:hypothetical protein